jgi:hypothetical protein
VGREAHREIVESVTAARLQETSGTQEGHILATRHNQRCFLESPSNSSRVSGSSFGSSGSASEGTVARTLEFLGIPFTDGNFKAPGDFLFPFLLPTGNQNAAMDNHLKFVQGFLRSIHEDFRFVFLLKS